MKLTDTEVMLTVLILLIIVIIIVITDKIGKKKARVKEIQQKLRALCLTCAVAIRTKDGKECAFETHLLDQLIQSGITVRSLSREDSQDLWASMKNNTGDLLILGTITYRKTEQSCYMRIYMKVLSRDGKKVLMSHDTEEDTSDHRLIHSFLERLYNLLSADADSTQKTN